MVGTDHRCLPGIVGQPNRRRKGGAISPDPRAGKILKISLRDLRHTESPLLHRDHEAIGRQAGQGLAQRTAAGTVNFAQGFRTEPRPRFEASAQDVFAQTMKDASRQGKRARCGRMSIGLLGLGFK